MLAEEIVVDRRDDAAHDHHDVLPALLAQLRDQLRHKCFVTGRLRAHPHRVHVRLNRLAGDFAWGLEERANVHVPPEVREPSRDHLGAAVVPVLPHLRHQDARPPARLGDEVLHGALYLGDLVLGVLVLGHVRPRHHVVPRHVPPPHLLQRVRNLAHRRARLRGVDGELEEVLRKVARRVVDERGGVGECVEGLLDFGRIAGPADGNQALHLLLAHVRVVNHARLDRILLLWLVLVDADNHVLGGVDARLLARGTLLDAHLGHTRRDGLGHSTQLLHLLHNLHGAVVEVLRQGLDEIRPAKRISDLGDARLLLYDELGVARNAGGEFSREGDGLVESVRVQALRPSKHRRHGLHRRPNHVVVRVLLCE
mmetsp:Transcript_23350/g.40185  ORF Transcript_23350/g.40185 Transcript_23350/m.40185 type:complete len:368 (-) Transcript_23350:602-1705(-)